MADLIHLVFRNSQGREVRRGNYVPHSVRLALGSHFVRNPNGYVEIHYQFRERFAFTNEQAQHISDQLGLPTA